MELVLYACKCCGMEWWDDGVNEDCPLCESTAIVKLGGDYGDKEGRQD